MAETFSGAVQPSSIEKSEHIETNNVGAKRVLAVGSDGSNMQDLATDGDGHLQVDVLTGGGGGTLVTDNEAVNAADTGILVLGTDGANYQIIKTDSDGNVQVEIASALPAGTNAIGKLASNTGVDIGDVDVASIAAGDNNIGNVDIASAIPAGTNIIGAVKRDVINYTPIRKYYTYSGAVTDGIVWSPTSGKKWVITDLVVNLSAAGAVTFEEDLAAGDSAFMKFEFAANGGCAMPFQTPIFSGEDDADLLVTTSAGNVYVTVTGYEID